MNSQKLSGAFICDHCGAKHTVGLRELPEEFVPWNAGAFKRTLARVGGGQHGLLYLARAINTSPSTMDNWCSESPGMRNGARYHHPGLRKAIQLAYMLRVDPVREGWFNLDLN